MARRGVKEIRAICIPGSEIDIPEFTPLLHAYAQAMWSWNRAENKLFVLFALCVGRDKPDVNQLRAAFFSVISAAGRIDMLHAAAGMYWKKTKAWKPWIDLYYECKTQLGIRGRMAHLIGSAYKDRNGKYHALVTPATWHPDAPMSYGQAKNSGFDVQQLSAYALDWEHLSNRLGVFVALAEEVMKPQASEKLIAGLLRLLGSQDDQIHAGLKALRSQQEKR